MTDATKHQAHAII